MRVGEEGVGVEGFLAGVAVEDEVGVHGAAHEAGAGVCVEGKLAAGAVLLADGAVENEELAAGFKDFSEGEDP